MLPTEDCEACVPDYARVSGHSGARVRSYAVFISTFVGVMALALRRILPRHSTHEKSDGKLPLHNYEFASNKQSPKGWMVFSKDVLARRLMYVAFAMNIGLSSVLVELLLCEISNLLDPKARSYALGIVLPCLILFLTLVSPAAQILSVLQAMGLVSKVPGKGRLRIAWFFEAIGLIVWLSAFWYLGKAFLEMYLRAGDQAEHPQGFIQGCLERIGIIGITLMAALSGFAAVSAVWQTFLVKRPLVTDAEVNRRQSGLEATEEMLETKRSRLRAVERKLSDVSSRGVFTTVVSTLRGTGDSKERSLLAMEINGLESMRMLLQDQLYLIKSRKEEQERKHTLSGRLILAFTYAFASFCFIRLGSVAFGCLRRILSEYPSSTSDPVTTFLSILSRNWDASLDEEAWARQISFLFSGFMLLAAFNSALQTFLLLGRAIPGLAISAAAAFREATTLALLISQFVATYVISAAMMLRSSVPKDVSSVISEALGAPLEPARVDAWFEACFLFTALLTAIGIWIGNKFRESTDVGDDVELGKMN